MLAHWPLQVQELSQWIIRMIDACEVLCTMANVVMGLFLEAGMPYVLAALGCMHAGYCHFCTSVSGYWS